MCAYSVIHPPLLYFCSLEYFKAAMEKRMNILKQAKENIGKAQDKQKKDYDKRHHCPDTFKVSRVKVAS